MLQNMWMNLIKNLHYILQRSVILAFYMIDRDWHWGLVGMTRTQINGTFLFQNRVKVKVVGEVLEK